MVAWDVVQFSFRLMQSGESLYKSPIARLCLLVFALVLSVHRVVAIGLVATHENEIKGAWLLPGHEQVEIGPILVLI